MYGFFYIIRHIPLAEATLVKMSAPFFIPLVAYFWLKDTVSVRTGLSIVIGFIGVVIILRPGTETFNPVVLWGLLAALLASIAKVTIRKMASTEHAVRIVIYFAFFSTLFSLFPALFQWQPVNLTTWGLFALSGLLGTLGQLTITEAYRISPPGKVGLYTYSTIIYASLLGWWFWGEHLNYYTIIGFIFILSAGIINYRKP